MIAKPGIYYDIPANDYHADPCPDPSFTQSLAKIVIARSPWHAWAAHPRLNPNYQREDATKFDVGTVAHAILLGRGKTITVVDADDWRTKAAKEAREDAAANGCLGVLRHQYDLADAMARSAIHQLGGRFGFDYDLFERGHSEVVLAWTEGEAVPIWCRAMIDWLSHDRRTVIDFKTTKASAAPVAIPMKMASDGWCIQAAMHERALNALDPLSAGRREHLFICQECEPPYAVSVTRIREGALTMGRKQLAHAFEQWRRCLIAGKWDGYETGGVIEPEYPGHLETRWLEREIEEDGRIPSNILAAG